MAGQWKHGWIPLDTAAAMSKAHGSKKGAASALASAHVVHVTPKGGLAARTAPKSAPKVKNPGGRNMQDLSGPKRVKGARGNSGIVDLGTLPPGFGKRR
jgi:hypothetical protein